MKCDGCTSRRVPEDHHVSSATSRKCNMDTPWRSLSAALKENTINLWRTARVGSKRPTLCSQCKLDNSFFRIFVPFHSPFSFLISITLCPRYTRFALLSALMTLLQILTTPCRPAHLSTPFTSALLSLLVPSFHNCVLNSACLSTLSLPF